MSNKIQTIILSDDIIEIFYNSMLSKKPYLIRLTSYNNQYELRADKEEIDTLTTILSKLINDDPVFT